MTSNLNPRESTHCPHVIPNASYLPDWAPATLAHFRNEVTSVPFPCSFARAGGRAGQHRYAFPRNVSELANALDTFLPAAAEGAYGDLTSLACFFPDSIEWHHRDVDHLRRHVFQILDELADMRRDDRPDVSDDPSNAGWRWYYGGHPVFVVALSPVYRLRRSRHFDRFCLLWQPYHVFKNVTPCHRNTIRENTERYDGVRIAAEVNTYGLPENREADQFVLPDGVEGDRPSCPLSRLGRALARPFRRP